MIHDNSVLGAWIGEVVFELAASGYVSNVSLALYEDAVRLDQVVIDPRDGVAALDGDVLWRLGRPVGLNVDVVVRRVRTRREQQERHGEQSEEGPAHGGDSSTHGHVLRITTLALAPRPTVCASALRAPSTCRAPARPCN